MSRPTPDDPPIFAALRREQRFDDPPTEEIRLPEQPEVHVFEPTDPRLKRHVVHDPRSRAYALTSTTRPTQPVLWERRGPVLDQGQVGSCTANTAVGLLMTTPFSTGKLYTETDALAIYHEETVLDEREIPGVYPPADTGSAGIYAMKALQNRKLITGYSHAFSLDAALAALARGPIGVGSVWLQSMFTPDGAGYLRVDKRSGVAGGHEYVVDGFDPVRDAVRMTNSWGPGWGRNGQAWIKTADFGWLLAQQGDVVQPTVAARRAEDPAGHVGFDELVADFTALLEKVKRWFAAASTK